MCFLLNAAYFSLLRYREPEMLMSSARTHTTCLQALVRALIGSEERLGSLLSIQQLLCEHGCQASGWFSKCLTSYVFQCLPHPSHPPGCRATQQMPAAVHNNLPATRALKAQRAIMKITGAARWRVRQQPACGEKDILKGPCLHPEPELLLLEPTRDRQQLSTSTVPQTASYFDPPSEWSWCTKGFEAVFCSRSGCRH